MSAQIEKANQPNLALGMRQLNGVYLTEVPKAQWKQLGKSLDGYANEFANRSEAMAHAYLDGGHRMNEIAKQFGVHYATVSRAVKKKEKEMYDCKT